MRLLVVPDPYMLWHPNKGDRVITGQGRKDIYAM